MSGFYYAFGLIFRDGSAVSSIICDRCWHLK